MSDIGIDLRCLRCGTPMDLRDPAPGTAWSPQQFWVCSSCGRHFWTTYPAPKSAADAPAKTEAQAPPPPGS